MKIDQRCINAIRFLSADGVEKANSGHPGLPMGCASIAHTLWSKHLNVSPKNSRWMNRDRFVLSAGHGSMLQYSLLHLYGFDVSIDDLKNFRQWESKTPGHPEYLHTDGVDITTGPLGQGLSGAVGMAIAQTVMASNFNKDGYNLFDNYTYVIAGDGDMMEGVTSEAASLAGHLKLNKLICFYDDNEITIDGGTSLSFSEDVGNRYLAYGWNVIKVDDGNNMEKIDSAIKDAKKCEDKPTLIVLKTIIGFGSPNKQGTSGVHGAPLGKDELKLAKENMDWYPEKEFYVPDDVLEFFAKNIKSKNESYDEWKKLFESYRANYPELAAKYDKWISGELSGEDLEKISSYEIKKANNATRNSGGEVINVIADQLDNLIGGSADLNPSTKTYLNNFEDYTPENTAGRNLRFGVREHGMAAILNGMALYGGLKVFGSTFFVFSDYMKPSLRLAAIMKLPVVHVLTHDSIGVGEDGPTHQPIEHLISLRAIPNMTVIRPCDGKETLNAWIAALQNTTGPTTLVLTRQNLPDITSDHEVSKGAYVIGDAIENPDIILMASGSEVQHIVKAKEMLEKDGIKVQAVSFPSMELFENQPESYKEKVLPSTCKKRVACEAGSDHSWYKYVGFEGKIIAMNGFGASAPAELLMEKYGFTAENVIKTALEVLKK